MANKKVEPGAKFERLEVVAFVRRHRKHSIWSVKCTCGAVREVTASNLVTGGTRSCGCLTKEWARKLGRLPKPIKHGMNRTPEQRVWIDMRSRCRNTKLKNYKDYGGRGIRVCDAWDDPKTGFARFISDMGHRPSDAYSIERNNNDGPYSPDNCCWALLEQQVKNKRPKSSKHMWTAGERTMSAKAWSRELSIPYHTLMARFNKGWTHRQVLGLDPPPPRKSLMRVGSRRWRLANPDVAA